MQVLVILFSNLFRKWNIYPLFVFFLAFSHFLNVFRLLFPPPQNTLSFIYEKKEKEKYKSTRFEIMLYVQYTRREFWLMKHRYLSFRRTRRIKFKYGLDFIYEYCTGCKQKYRHLIIQQDKIKW